MGDVAMVMSLVGCTQEEAERSLLKHETVIEAVDSLLGSAPVVSGTKYIPAPPEVDHGLNQEQAERCAKGRDLQDKVNAVFSVAHSKVRDQPLTLEDGGSPHLSGPAAGGTPRPAEPEFSELEQDSHAQRIQ
jgi:hypothetical protein